MGGTVMVARRPAGRRRSANEVSVVTSGYGQVTSGYWPAVVIGTVELLILIMYTIAAVRHEVRRRRDASTLLSVLLPPDELAGEAGDPPLRCWALIAEAIIVRERLSGEIDAETYRARMNDIARQAIPEHRPQRNA
jgi:hypothetical protein